MCNSVGCWDYELEMSTLDGLVSWRSSVSNRTPYLPASATPQLARRLKGMPIDSRRLLENRPVACRRVLQRMYIVHIFDTCPMLL